MVALARRQQLKQAVVGVAGVFDNPAGLTDTPSIVNVLNGGKLTSTDDLGCLHDPLQCFVIEVGAVPIPDSDVLPFGCTSLEGL